MDPVSHAIIGLSIHALNQAPVIGNPALFGTVLGAMAPDLDVITKVKGDYVLLKHHRVETHSLLGIAMLSVLITLALSLFYSDFLFKEVLLWTFIGSLSHVLFDLFNSYGVALLYPLNRKKYSLNLINIYDPVILLLSGYIIFFSRRTIYEHFFVGAVFILYLLSKELNKRIQVRKIYNFYNQNPVNKINSISFMPSDYSVFKWDYIVNTQKEYILGEVKLYRGTPVTFKHFPKSSNQIIEKSQNEALALYFKDFTPFFHVECKEVNDGFIVKMIDLRYKIKNEFKHHAMFYYCSNAELLKSVFHPFKMDNQIEVSNKVSK